MASLNDYKRHIQVLKMEQKIGRIQRELESVNYGDECPLHGENDCAEVRKAYDRGYVNGLYEALTLFKLIEADTSQMERQRLEGKRWTDTLTTEEKKCMLDALDIADTPQTDLLVKTPHKSRVSHENNCETCRDKDAYDEWEGNCDECENGSMYTPQTDYPTEWCVHCELWREDNCIGVAQCKQNIKALKELSDLYVADTPQTEEYDFRDEQEYNDRWQTDCDRYVITNDEGDKAYNCIGCTQTDCYYTDTTHFGKAKGESTTTSTADTPQTDCPWHDDNAMCNRCGETDCPWK